MAHGTVWSSSPSMMSSGPRPGFLVSTFASVHGFRLALAAWNSVTPEPGTAKVAYSSCASASVTALAKANHGRSLETLGLYDPLRKDPAQKLRLDEERTRWWIEHGAVPSEIMQSLFKQLGVFPKKPHVKRDRSARKPNAATKRRHEAQKVRLAAKAERYKARVAAKKAAGPAEGDDKAKDKKKKK